MIFNLYFKFCFDLVTIAFILDKKQYVTSPFQEKKLLSLNYVTYPYLNIITTNEDHQLLYTIKSTMLELYCSKLYTVMYNPEKQYTGGHFTVFNPNFMFILCECHFGMMILSSRN